jgi:hypothetical protein
MGVAYLWVLLINGCIFFMGAAYLHYVYILTAGSVTCTDVDRHKIVSGSNDRTVKVRAGIVYQGETT